jgi:hypothetical protein
MVFAEQKTTDEGTFCQCDWMPGKGAEKPSMPRPDDPKIAYRPTPAMQNVEKQRFVEE